MHGTVFETTDRDWDFSFDLNVKSMHRTIKAWLPGMLERGNGSIVNIASGASSVKAAANRYVYGATKAAVIGLTKALAIDFIRKGVRCNAICPGTIESPSLDQRIVDQAKATGKSRGRDAPDVRRPPAHGPARHARGDRGHRGLSGERRVALHHRPAPPRRRRLGDLNGRDLLPVREKVAARRADG